MDEPIAYWDSIAESVNPENTMGIKDNWWKRQCLVKHLLDYSFEARHILEIGCGAAITAGIMSILHGGMFHYVGTDISPKFCAIAKRFWKFEIIASTIQDLKFKPGTFDCLWAFDVLEHISFDQRLGCYEVLSRIMKEKARVFINNPDEKNPNGHDMDFEFGMADDDIAAMAKIMEMKIERITPYAIYDKRKNKRQYQFIVMSRG